MTIPTDAARHAFDGITVQVEQYVKLYVKPRPAWMPERLYRWIMGRLVLYESLPKVTMLPKDLHEAAR